MHTKASIIVYLSHLPTKYQDHSKVTTNDEKAISCQSFTC